MSRKVQTFKLSDGAEIPWLAWGNGTGNAKKRAFDCGIAALEAGVYHVDSAQIYGTEKEVNESIQKTGIDRSKTFVTSKIFNPHKTDEETRASIEESISKLGGVPDLFLIHNPFPKQPEALLPTWKVMEDMKDEGRLKSLGVSNFRPQDWERLLANCRYKPVAHQLEYHPFLLKQLEPVLAIHKKHNIVAESYGPLTASMRFPKESELTPVLKRISERLSKEAGFTIDEHAVNLFWCKAKGVVAVTASGSEERIKGLGQIAQADVGLTDEEVKEIDDIGMKYHYRYYDEHMQDVDETMPVPKLDEQHSAGGRQS